MSLCRCVPASLYLLKHTSPTERAYKILKKISILNRNMDNYSFMFIARHLVT